MQCLGVMEAISGAKRTEWDVREKQRGKRAGEEECKPRKTSERVATCGDREARVMVWW